MNYDIAIQIVNYNTKPYLRICLDSLLNDLKDSHINYLITVLDNHSEDDLSDLKREYANLPVNFYFSEKNIGFGAGHNFLSQKSQSRYLLLVNPDVEIIEHSTIKRLLFEIQRTKASVIGPKLLNSNLTPQAYDHSELFGLKAFIARKAGSSYWKRVNTKTEAAWISGSFFLIDKKTFESVGKFDEKFFLYKEEEDLCLRIRNQGGIIIYLPEVRVKHTGSVVAKKSAFMRKSLRYFNQKHFPLLSDKLRRLFFEVLLRILLVF